MAQVSQPPTRLADVVEERLYFVRVPRDARAPGHGHQDAARRGEFAAARYIAALVTEHELGRIRVERKAIQQVGDPELVEGRARRDQGVHRLVVQQDRLADIALAALVRVHEGDPPGQERRVSAGRGVVLRVVGVQRVGAGAEGDGQAPLDGFGTREMQGGHDVIRRAGDARIAYEVAHGRNGNGEQDAPDRDDQHQFEQRESGLGSFHGSHYKECITRNRGPSDGRSRRGDERRTGGSRRPLMSARV